VPIKRLGVFGFKGSRQFFPGFGASELDSIRLGLGFLFLVRFGFSRPAQIDDVRHFHNAFREKWVRSHSIDRHFATALIRRQIVSVQSFEVPVVHCRDRTL
jgi:hypothetical protein